MTNVTATAGDMGSSGGGTPPALPLVVFCTAAVAAMSLIIRPLPVPTGRGRTLKLHYSVPVALGVAVLLLSGSASLRDLVNGMRGDEHVKPLQVLAIFYSMAYLCVALDLTGLFAAIALAITNRMPEGRLGPFLTYFVMCSVMTLFTSNDVVILTFTPIIVYFARATATDPMPLLYTQFYVANTWSALFYIGNPTNVIVAQAYKLGFFQYTSVTALPTLVAGLLTLLLLLLAFYPPRCLSTRLRWCRRRSTSSAPEASPQPAARPYEPGVRVAGTLALDNVAASAPPADRQSPPQQRQAQAASAEAVDNDEAAGKHNSDVTRVWYGRTGHHESNARAALVHPLLAALGSVVLLACLAMLAAADAIGWAPWLITSLCAAAMLLLNIVLQPWLPPSARAHIDCCDARCKGRRSPGTALRQGFLDEDGAALSLPSTPAARRASGHAAARSAAARDGAVDASADEEAGEGAAAVEAAGPAGGGAKNQAAEEEASGEPSSSGEQAAAATVTVWTALWRLPWSLLPFVAGMFILTSILKDSGWIQNLAQHLAAAIGDNVFVATMLVGFLSLLLANTINNQPMTILVTHLLLGMSVRAEDGTCAADACVSQQARRGAMYALAVGSNLGANLTLVGALAGIMWATLLAQKGLHVTYLQFLRRGVVFALPISAVTLAVLAVQLENGWV